MRHTKPRRPALAALIAIALAGCEDEALNPLGGGSSSGDASSSGSGSSSSGMETPVREVFVRNPWGMPANNLLADGDFEFSSARFDGQYGWVLVDQTSGATLTLAAETGGLCKSGLRCGIATKGAILFGRGTSAPKLAPMRATMYAKPDPPDDGDLEKNCKATLDAYAIDCDTFDILEHLASIGAPDPKGWCEYGVDVPGSSGPVCLYADLKRNAVVDACTLLQSGDPPPNPTPRARAQGTPEMRRTRDILRSRRRFDVGPSADPERPLRETNR
ncbi:MAG: hypothetical protein U0414_14275 [Polyangiaceae bacterium]